MDVSGSRRIPAGLKNLVAISGGSYHALGLRADGTVVWWGYDPYYCGVPEGLSNVVAIASGLGHDLALKGDGTVVEWPSIGVPDGLSNVVSIAGGRSHSLVAKSDGTCVTWGWMSGPAYVPPGLSNVVAVGAGWDNSVALKSDGTVVGWGNHGEAMALLAVNDVASIAVGYSGGVALRSNGTVVTWGSVSPPPPGLTDVARITAKWFWALAWKTDGTFVAWGDNSGGQLDVPNRLTNVLGIAAEQYTGVVLVGDGPPQALWTLSNVVGVAEGTVFFDGTAVGTEPLSYQWRLNGTNLPDATGPVFYTNICVRNGQPYFYPIQGVGGAKTALLALTNIQPHQAGLYSVVISNGYGVMTNSGAVLKVIPALVTTQPVNQTVYGGDAVTNEVVIQGPMSSFQWRFRGTNLPGETNAQLVIPNVTTNQGGEYSVVISNSYGSVVGSNADLIVIPIAIVTQPTNRTVFVGDSTTFSVTAARNGPFTYQWRFNGSDLSDQTNRTLSLSAATASDSGVYSVLVANPYGSIESSNALLSVLDSPPVISSSPRSQGAYPGRNVSFHVGADGSKPLSYQWFLNGLEINDATNATLVLTNVTAMDTGSYKVRVRNALGEVFSANAMLTFLSVVTWGATNYYDLGTVPWNLTNAIAVAAGVSHSVALKSDGIVVAWGESFVDGVTNVPPGLSNVIAIAAAGDHTIALRSNGTVVSWGDLSAVPAGLTDVVAISAGRRHSLALKADGTVVAWGGPFSGSVTNVPAGLSNVVAIAAASTFNTALKRDGTISIWGSGPFVAGISNAIAIAAGEFPLVILKADRKIITFNALPAPANLSNVVAVAAGRYHALALKSDGVVTNWSSIGPVTPAGLPNIAILASGEYHCLGIIGIPASRQALLVNPKRSSDEFSFSLSSQSGRVYGLEYKNSLSDPNWKFRLLVPGNGGVLVLKDAIGTNFQRFYRVLQW